MGSLSEGLPRMFSLLDLFPKVGLYFVCGIIQHSAGVINRLGMNGVVQCNLPPSKVTLMAATQECT